jgi:hypothetical protein
MIHYIERVGAKIIRTASVPCARSVPEPGAGARLEFLPLPVQLPAYWADGQATPLPHPPSPSHRFSYDSLTWEPDMALAWQRVRAERDARLSASDWVRLRANDLGEAVPMEWLEYRQALRDVTNQLDPLGIQWPTPPG